jgi:N6-adenosine-specific RNA methylase IME4
LTQLMRYDAACRALAECSSVDEVKDILDKAEAIRAYARQADNPDLQRQADQIRFRAKDRLGELLAQSERNRGAANAVPNRNSVPTLDELGIARKLSAQAQQIAALEEEEKARILAAADVDKATKQALAKSTRQNRHQDIAAKAKEVAGDFGPFPLIYADPPWKFEIYSEKGLDRTPDQHYPTMSYEDIANLTIVGNGMDKIAAKDAALLMWCTSSNLVLALGIMNAWGFTFKSSGVWVKTKEDGGLWTGLGLVFRNGHEILLYGTKGNMPGPQYQPPSVFMYTRGRHSAKPVEIRAEIERMYPDFDASSRVELFCREQVEGWTTWGFEAVQEEAA